MDVPTKVAVAAIASAALFSGALFAARRARRRFGTRLGIPFVLFAALFSLWLPMFLLRLDGRLGSFHFSRELGAATFLTAVCAALAITRQYLIARVFGQGTSSAVPRFAFQVAAIVVFLIALLLVVGVAYNKEVSTLLFGSSGVLAIVIGFAMQDLLGNLIAGITINVTKEYEVGDFLFIEGQYAEVMEVNWRSTRLRNNDGVYLDIPNSSIVKGTIINVNYGVREYAIRIPVGVDYAIPPNRVKAVLVEAMRSVPGVLAEPKAKVFLKEFGDSALQYEIKFWMNDHRRFNDITDGVRTAAWYALHRAGMSIPFPIRTVRIDRTQPRDLQPGRVAEFRELATRNQFFACLAPDELEILLGRTRFVDYGAGDFIMEKGSPGSSMFTIVRGSAAIHLDHPERAPAVARLGCGDCVGEMSLLTGEPRVATVVASEDSLLAELEKGDFAVLLERNSTLSQKFSELLAQRKMQLEALAASSQTAPESEARRNEYVQMFLRKISAFFEV
jgi:small-conductance mechanosensitive channel/CRP-like cAMP-binding protein